MVLGLPQWQVCDTYCVGVTWDRNVMLRKRRFECEEGQGPIKSISIIIIEMSPLEELVVSYIVPT